MNLKLITIFGERSEREEEILSEFYEKPRRNLSKADKISIHNYCSSEIFSINKLFNDKLFHTGKFQSKNGNIYFIIGVGSCHDEIIFEYED